MKQNIDIETKAQSQNRISNFKMYPIILQLSEGEQGAGLKRWFGREGPPG